MVIKPLYSGFVTVAFSCNGSMILMYIIFKFMHKKYKFKKKWLKKQQTVINYQSVEIKN